MNKFAIAAASLLLGLFGFLAVGVAVTELLAPYVWPSLLLGLPAGLVAGVALVALTYLALSYREQQRTTGTASEQTVQRFWTTVGALVGFVAGGTIAVVALSTQAIGFVSAMLVAGLPVGIVSGLVLAYVVYRRDWDRRAPPASPA